MVTSDTLLITNEYVRQALDQLIQTSSVEHINPLQYLQLIEIHMLTADFSFFQQPRQFALNDLLISVIQRQYDYQRGLHNLNPVRSGSNRELATVIVKEDAATANPDLIGWSWLYFHYVEVRLHISQQKFCETVNLDDRTIRRYHTNIIDQLTKQLIRKEQAARETRRNQLLHLQLPHQGNVPELVERDQILQQLRLSKSKHVHIIGAPGIGKTVIVEGFLQEMINNNELDQIIWFQSPESTQSLRLSLKERLLIENSTVSISEYVFLKRVAIVIDDCDSLQQAPDLNNFMQEMSNAYIFLMSHIFYPLPDCFQLVLPELSFSATKDLLTSTNGDYKEYLENNSVIQVIWQTLGGNPLAIKLLGQNWSIFDVQSAALLTLDQLFSSLYASLIPSERLAWLILAVLNKFSSTLSELYQIGSPHVNIDDFAKLSRLCVAITASRDSSNIGLTLSAQRYIQYQYETSDELQKAFDAFIALINLDSEVTSEITLALIEAVLSTQWIQIDPDYLLEATHQFWNEGILRGHYTKWHSILSKYNGELTKENIDLVLGYGICQRYLGQLSHARSVFTRIVNYTGQYGDFFRQAQALLELAILSRYQGDYETVGQALTHIDMLPSAHLDAFFRNRLIIERLELALEKNDVRVAKDLLNSLPDKEPRKNVLQLEIYAKEALGSLEIATASALGDKLFSDFDYNASIIARVHILMGRIWERNSYVEATVKHLSIALSLLLEQDNDPFALARTQSNFASVLMKVKRLSEARELINSAKLIQRHIGDRVGLAATIHNERVLDRLIVS